MCTPVRPRSPGELIAPFAVAAVAAALGPDVVAELGGALQPVAFRSADDGTFTTLLMPVRLD